MRVKTGCKDQGGQEARQEGNGGRRGEEMMGAGPAPSHDPCGFLFRDQDWDQRALQHVVLFQSPCVAPQRARMQRLYSRRRGLLHPDMMCLTNAGKKDKISHCTWPISALYCPLGALNLFALSLLSDFKPPHYNSFSYLGVGMRKWEREENSPLLCVHSAPPQNIDEMSYITPTNPHNLEKGACITPLSDKKTRLREGK